MFIFVLIKQHVTEKIVSFIEIQTWIIRLEGEHADHQTTAQRIKCHICMMMEKIFSIHRLI